jgi:hypothetical protein
VTAKVLFGDANAVRIVTARTDAVVQQHEARRLARRGWLRDHGRQQSNKPHR